MWISRTKTRNEWITLQQTKKQQTTVNLKNSNYRNISKVEAWFIHFASQGEGTICIPAPTVSNATGWRMQLIT